MVDSDKSGDGGGVRGGDSGPWGEMCRAGVWGPFMAVRDRLWAVPGQIRASLAAALQALQEDRLTALMGQQGQYSLCWTEHKTGSRPFLRMAVSRVSWVGGGLCHSLLILRDRA